MEYELQLGDKARHAITGFEGIVVAKVQYLTGCDQVCLQPQGLTDKGDTFDHRYFDAPYVDLVQAGAVLNRTPGRVTGCDIAPPSRRG
jgi:hypothetical protein